MDKNLIEKYKNDLMRIYNARASTRSAPPLDGQQPNAAEPQRGTNGRAQAQASYQGYIPKSGSGARGAALQAASMQPGAVTNRTGEAAPVAPIRGDTLTDTGRLIAIVSTLRGLYPVPGAKVTVFTGPLDDMTVIDTGTTDQSGRSKTFELAAPSREISLDSESTELPYALYNLKVEADGYADNIHLNIPVFRGVTSLQKAYMTQLSISGGETQFIYNEAMQYKL